MEITDALLYLLLDCHNLWIEESHDTVSNKQLNHLPNKAKYKNQAITEGTQPLMANSFPDEGNFFFRTEWNRMEYSVVLFFF